MKAPTPYRSASRFRPLALLGLLLALWLGRPPAARAESGDLLLLPSSPRAFVGLAALNVNVSIECAEGACAWEIVQVYHLQNRDRLKGSEIQVALQGAQSGAGQPVSVSFSPEAQASAAGEGAWTLRFGAEQTIVATVRAREPLESPSFALWQWDGSGLDAWGPLTSARMELRLPSHMPEDLFLAQQPAADGFDGRTLYWEYESPPALEPFRVWLLTPLAWEREETLRSQGEHLSLAQFYRDLGREAARTGAPYADPYALALGALQVAASQDPSPAPHLALADLYLERAEEQPELDINYRLLAAEELEAALNAGATDPTISERLAQLYFGLAQQAHEVGDPTDALRYIGLARERAADGAVGDALTIETLTLDWAVDLASKGRVSEALLEANDVLSPRVQDALYRYAPPIIAARTEITLTARSRSVAYRFYLYPPLADATGARLQALADALNALPAANAALALHEQDGAPWASLALEVTYAGLADLAQIAHEVSQVGAAEADLPQALVAAPWNNSLAAFGVSRSPWLDYYAYQERPAFGALEALREEQAQYTVWRLVEVSSAQPDLERDRLEMQLTALALREQRQIWENLSSSSYWAYHVAFEEPSALPALSWLVGWGQERDLEVSHRFFWWRRIAEHAGIALGALGLLAALTAWGRSKRRRGGARPAAPEADR